MDIKRCKTPEAAHITSSKENDTKDVGQRCKENVLKQRVIGGWLLRLPLPLIYEVLLRLNIETLFSCKCVCKTFFEILTDPHFAEIRLTKAPNIDSGLVIQDRTNISDVLLVYNYKHETDGHGTGNSGSCVSSRLCQTFSMPTVAAETYNSYVYFVGSCNGLLCVRYRTRELNFYYYICNPILGEFVALPQDINLKPSIQISGFGFCPKTKQYKVIRFFTPSLCEIHTLGTDNWRRIYDPPPYPHSMGCFDCSYRGNFHWVIGNFTVKNLICSFNLETEQTSIFPAPIHLNKDAIGVDQYKFSKLSCIETGTLGGLFCLGYLLRNRNYQVCVMKDYGVNESWTLDFNIDLTLISGLQQRSRMFVLKLSDNGDLFFKCETSSVVCYSLQKGTITDLLANNVFTVSVTPFLPSFISLKDVAIALRGNVEVVQRKMGRNLWSNEGFHFMA